MSADPHVVVGSYTRPMYTVATLPAAASMVNEILFVNDQTYGPNAYGSIASGGGGFISRVRSDGSQWRVETYGGS